VCVCCLADCAQPCTAGFFCPEGSLSAQERACGGSASNPLAAAVFCPTGSSNATAVSAGWYSTGSAPEAPHQRSGQAMCPAGSYCIDGVRVRAQRSLLLDSPVLLCLVSADCEGWWAFLRLLTSLGALLLSLPFGCFTAHAGWCAPQCFHVTKEASHVVSLSVLLALLSSLVKTECPSGTYGATPGLTSPNCTGLCSVGYECPAGSDVPTRLICPAGFFCAGGPKQACPAGRYRYSVRPLDSSFAPLCSEAIALPLVPAAF